MMNDRKRTAAFWSGALWGGVLLLCLIVVMRIFVESKPEEVITGPDTVEKYTGPIVAFEQRGGGVKITVRDLGSGELGSGLLKYDEPEKWEEVKEIVENEEYDAVIQLCLEYSSQLVEEERYYYRGYPICGAWLYKVDEISKEFSGKVLTYFENETGKLVVIRDEETDDLVYVQFSDESNMDEEMKKMLESETCGVDIVVLCKFYEYVNYDGYPVLEAKMGAE